MKKGFESIWRKDRLQNSPKNSYKYCEVMDPTSKSLSVKAEVCRVLLLGDNARKSNVCTGVILELSTQCQLKVWISSICTGHMIHAMQIHGFRIPSCRITLITLSANGVK